MSEINKIKNYHEKLNRSLLSRERARSSEDDHHMEFVDEISGIAYINDARAINVPATRNSIESIETSVVLITGGDDRDSDYSMLTQVIKQKVVAVIYLGNNSDNILKHFSAHSMLFAKADSVNEAVQIAACFSRSGDVVLFSPACSGCHHQDNYKNRGNEFKDLIKKMRA
jgi:UDP-N-acetylmuramoylalanine--D-glutamate ligase